MRHNISYLQFRYIVCLQPCDTPVTVAKKAFVSDLQECVKIVEGCLTVKNLWELLTGDDGTDLA